MPVAVEARAALREPIRVGDWVQVGQLMQPRKGLKRGSQGQAMHTAADEWIEIAFPSITAEQVRLRMNVGELRVVKRFGAQESAPEFKVEAALYRPRKLKVGDFVELKADKQTGERIFRQGETGQIVDKHRGMFELAFPSKADNREHELFHPRELQAKRGAPKKKRATKAETAQKRAEVASRKAEAAAQKRQAAAAKRQAAAAKKAQLAAAKRQAAEAKRQAAAAAKGQTAIERANERAAIAVQRRALSLALEMARRLIGEVRERSSAEPNPDDKVEEIAGELIWLTENASRPVAKLGDSQAVAKFVDGLRTSTLKTQREFSALKLSKPIALEAREVDLVDAATFIHPESTAEIKASKQAGRFVVVPTPGQPSEGRKLARFKSRKAAVEWLGARGFKQDPKHKSWYRGARSATQAAEQETKPKPIMVPMVGTLTQTIPLHAQPVDPAKRELQDAQMQLQDQITATADALADLAELYSPLQVPMAILHFHAEPLDRKVEHAARIMLKADAATLRDEAYQMRIQTAPLLEKIAKLKARKVEPAPSPKTAPAARRGEAPGHPGDPPAGMTRAPRGAGPDWYTQVAEQSRRIEAAEASRARLQELLKEARHVAKLIRAQHKGQPDAAGLIKQHGGELDDIIRSASAHEARGVTAQMDQAATQLTDATTRARARHERGMVKLRAINIEAQLPTLSDAQWKALEMFAAPEGHGHGPRTGIGDRTANKLSNRRLVALGTRKVRRSHKPWGAATPLGFEALARRTGRDAQTAYEPIFAELIERKRPADVVALVEGAPAREEAEIQRITERDASIVAQSSTPETPKAARPSLGPGSGWHTDDPPAQQFRTLSMGDAIHVATDARERQWHGIVKKLGRRFATLQDERGVQAELVMLAEDKFTLRPEGLKPESVLRIVHFFDDFGDDRKASKKLPGHSDPNTNPSDAPQLEGFAVGDHVVFVEKGFSAKPGDEARIKSMSQDHGYIMLEPWRRETFGQETVRPHQIAKIYRKARVPKPKLKRKAGHWYRGDWVKLKSPQGDWPAGRVGQVQYAGSTYATIGVPDMQGPGMIAGIRIEELDKASAGTRSPAPKLALVPRTAPAAAPASTTSTPATPEAAELRAAWSLALDRAWTQLGEQCGLTVTSIDGDRATYTGSLEAFSCMEDALEDVTGENLSGTATSRSARSSAAQISELLATRSDEPIAADKPKPTKPAKKAPKLALAPAPAPAPTPQTGSPGGRLLSALQSIRTTLVLEEQTDDMIRLATRDHGSVEEGIPGPEDIAEAKRVAALVRATLGKRVQTRIDALDEWTHLTLTLAAPDEEKTGEIPAWAQAIADKRRAFAEKKAARVERLEDRAEKAKREAGAQYERSRGITEHIPMGQPILIGHHSERRHRRDLERSDTAMRKSIEAGRQAASLASRAESAASSRAIRSDDPDAPLALATRIGKLKAERERGKLINKIIRSSQTQAKKTDQNWIELAATAMREAGISQAVSLAAVKPDFAGRTGMPAYRLQNISSEIKRLEDRIVSLAQAEEREGREVTHGEVRMVEEDNRVRLFFPGKPDESTRAKLKQSGFRWARSEGAWQRHASNQAWYQGEEIAKAFEPAPAADAKHEIEWSIGETQYRLKSEPADFSYTVSALISRGEGRPGFKQDTLYKPTSRYAARMLHEWMADSGNRASVPSMDKTTFLAQLKKIGAYYDYQ